MRVTTEKSSNQGKDKVGKNMNKKWCIVASVCKTKVLAKQREFLIIFLHNTLQDKISRKIHRLSLVQLTTAKYINVHFKVRRTIDL